MYEGKICADEAPPKIGKERRIAGVDLTVERHWLRAHRGVEAENIDAARARGISLDVSLSGEGLQQIGDSLGRLDLELLADVADARLVSVLGGEVEKVVIHRALE